MFVQQIVHTEAKPAISCCMKVLYVFRLLLALVCLSYMYVIFQWSVELQDQEKVFLQQANQVNAWDRTLADSGEKVRDLSMKEEKAISRLRHFVTLRCTCTCTCTDCMVTEVTACTCTCTCMHV